jgi:hypothetical protein
MTAIHRFYGNTFIAFNKGGAGFALGNARTSLAHWNRWRYGQADLDNSSVAASTM